MKRSVAVVAAGLMGLPFYPALFARTGDDFSGRWEMEECDAAYARRYSRCELELEQRGTVVAGTARYGDEHERWTCAVKGRVVDGVLEMKWKGETKYWRGTARLRKHGEGLRGEYRREDVEGSGTQWCRGVRR